MARPRRYALPSPKRSPLPRVIVGLALTGTLIGALWWWWPRKPPPSDAKAHPATNAPSRAARQLTAPPPATRAAQAEPKPVVTRPEESATTSPETRSDPPAPTVMTRTPGSLWPRPVETVFEAQVALGRLGFSPGSLDALWGPKSRAALIAFQQRQGLPATGELDPPTRAQLLLTHPVLTTHTVSSNELAGLRPLGRTWLQKSEQDRLGHETIRELVAELGHCSPDLVERLNPATDWSRVRAGTTLQIPHFPHPTNTTKAAFARLRLGSRTLQAFDAATNLLAHFPVSVARFADKRPVGELLVAAVIPNPNYTFDPRNFPTSAEGQRIGRKLVLQPGPNNPVGTVWIGLNREGYGIHGTPSPESVGKAESAGCFRLTNWDAEFFLTLAWVGLPVRVEP